MAVPFKEAFFFWLKLGFINFGGPTGQIAIMHQELVERRRWVSDNRFLHALNFCMLLPGPEAQQLATYVGWLLHGTLGGIVAGTLFILPGFFIMLILSWLYAAHGEVFAVDAVFYGLRAAVMAVVAAALIRIGKKALRNGVMVAISAAAFVAIFSFHVPFPFIVLGAGVVGFLGGRKWPGTFITSSGHGEGGEGRGPETAIRDDQPSPPGARPTLKRTLLVLFTWLLIWWVPLGAVLLWRGWSDALSEEALFFSKAAMVTFGGAYAVLAYINQAAVEHYGWLERGQMIAGLGLAESTPGPLILVTEFVGFLGAYRHPRGLDPVMAGTLGALVTTWATFAPCFLWIFLLAPFIERLRGNVRLNAALSAITASVVGVILNLAVWFGWNTLFSAGQSAIARGAEPVPSLSLLDPFALVVATIGFWGIWRRRWGIIPLIGGSAVLGLIYRIAARALAQGG
jgi:chromate transporter